MTYDWKNLADHLVAARGGRTQLEMADAGGVSERSVQQWENCGVQRPGRQLRRYCASLGWTPDSLTRVLAGGEPAMDPLAQLAALDGLDEDTAAVLALLANGQLTERQRAGIIRLLERLRDGD